MDEQLPIFTPEQELAYAKTVPGGIALSPRAQELLEAEGARRFERFHSRATTGGEVGG